MSRLISCLCNAAAILAFLSTLLTHQVSAAAPAADSAEAGKRAFIVCGACHSIDGSAKSTGPSLKGIVGRKAASDLAYKKYSKALQASAIIWSSAELDPYLKAPSQRVKGTTMMVNVADAKRRLAIIRYLETLK
jgi:cytochrome c